MKKLFAILLLVGVLLTLFNVQAKEKTMKATWLWHTNTISEEDTVDFLLDQKVTTVFLQVNQDIKNNQYAAFIEKMMDADIEVQALDGAPDWTKQDFDKLWAWLQNYHDASPSTKFTAVHLDVEPYLTDLWDEDEAQAVYEFQQLMHYVQQQLANSNVQFEVDIPFWFDGVLYDNSFGKGNLAEWVISKVDRVSIMAYRDTFDAIVHITENEMSYGAKYQTPIVIGVETKSSSESQNVTFAEEGAQQMNKTLDELYKHFKDNKTFSGIAIHHVQSWQKMKE